MSTYARIFSNFLDASTDRDNYVYHHKADVASINDKQGKVEMRNGDYIYWIVMRSEQDRIKISGMEFKDVEIFGVDPQLIPFIKSRVRGDY